MIFTFLSSVVKVIGILKAYIMYLAKIEEFFPLSFNAYTLITNTLFHLLKGRGAGFITSYFLLG